MPFQVKATLVQFIGNKDRYPCHFKYKVGDEIIFDGEKFIGRICPDMMVSLAPKVAALHSAGPRYIPPEHYYGFWYSPLSVDAPEQQKYDGLGFKCVLKTIEEPLGDASHLNPPGAFQWPPFEGDVAKEVTVLCPDVRTAALFNLEAFDLSEKGHDMPYFRRTMVILHKALKKGGTLKLDKIIDEFGKEEIEIVYPALGPRLVSRLVEELELLGYVVTDGTNATVTDKGKKKLDTFKSGLAQEEVLALGI